jgi:Leucine-rich repeat (LRR) protein
MFLLCAIFSNYSVAQTNNRIYPKLEQVLKMHPDSVLYLDLSKRKLKSIPAIVYTFKNLKGLNVSKNGISELNDSIFLLKNLEELELGKNKFKSFPMQLCSISTLIFLSINRNEISSLPPCLSMLKSVETLDIWGTNISSFPESFVEMPNLKFLDARSMQFNAEFQWNWKKQLPNVKIEFDAPCNCF